MRESGILPVSRTRYCARTEIFNPLAAVLVYKQVATVVTYRSVYSTSRELNACLWLLLLMLVERPWRSGVFLSLAHSPHSSIRHSSARSQLHPLSQTQYSDCPTATHPEQYTIQHFHAKGHLALHGLSPISLSVMSANIKMLKASRAELL